MTGREHRWIGRFTRALGALPWLALAVVALSAIYTRASLGHWPVVYRDDPKGLLAGVALYASLIALCLTPAVAPLAVVALVIRHIRHVRPAFDVWIASALIGTLVFYFIERADPFGYLTWFFD